MHPDVQPDAGERARHARFLVTRLAAGVLALAALPLYLVLSGVPSPFEAIAFACLVAPLGAAFVLSRTGRLDWAHGLSSTALAALVTALACVSGGAASPIVVWLVAVPLEALLSGSRRTVIAASLIAATAAMLIAVLDASGALTASVAWPNALAMPIFAAAAIGHAAAVALDACRNQTDRRSEREARDARDRMVLEAIEDLVTWHDETGNVINASATADGLLETPARSLRGRGLFDRVHVADRPAFLKALADAAHGDRPCSARFRVQVGDDDPRDARRMASRPLLWVEMRARRVVAESAELDGHRPAIVAVTRDISGLKTREEDIDTARALAEAANAARGQFLATISHELRTPLNAIIGFSDILANQSLGPVDDARRTEYARIIHQSGQHLHEVVGALLDMSKIETGHFDFAPESFDFVGLADGCCDLMQLAAADAGVTLARAIDTAMPAIVGDRRALKQIVLNLLSNAIKFTPSGGRVTVGAWHDGDELVVRVADTGIGIDASDLPKIGNPFFQARSARNRTYEGTGLGLSVVRGLVGLHRGSLGVESAPGEGTTVTVKLPRDCRAAPPLEQAPCAIQTTPRTAKVSFLETASVKKRA